MKKYIYIVTAALCALATASCSDFLEKSNPNKIESEFFFTSEQSLEIYTNGLIQDYLPANTTFMNGDRYSDAQGWDGSYLFYTDNYDADDAGGWGAGNWSGLRSINYYLANMRKADAPEKVLNHYEGVGRFFRAMFYFDKVRTFGDVPWYDHMIEPDNKEDLYKARDSRELVCQKMLEDLNYACENCSADAKYMTRASYVNKYVALAMKARFCLYEGTYRKYHNANPSTGQGWSADESRMYLQECVKACKEIMDSKAYSLATNYRNMFTSRDACGDGDCLKEFIWARDYSLDLVVNNDSYSVNDLMINAQHAQHAFNRDFVMTYLMTDGTPFTTKNPDYYSVKFIDEFKGRDARMAQTMRTPGFTREDGNTKWGAPDLVYAKSGYQPVKWLTDYIMDQINDKTATDVPVIRYAEVLLNYAEAKAELGELTEAVWNESVKLVRERAGVKSIYPTAADPYMVNYFLGRVTDPLILEVRRERGCEFTMENLRQHDIRRWAMGELLIKQKTGLWIDAIETPLDLNGDGKPETFVSKTVKEKAGYAVLDLNAAAGHRLSEGDYGYILPNTAMVAGYTWSGKKYLNPIPNSAIIVNENLKQNYGW
ncbi:MAG: RagB/SusD family nutrient uptake outer membrane protein [Bacteroidales bacterium]|jgi:hypothetical protein|nr:RagB/SusD family nutrient uptake outer membrane protein [Bacteroidales bacterium]